MHAMTNKLENNNNNNNTTRPLMRVHIYENIYTLYNLDRHYEHKNTPTLNFIKATPISAHRLDENSPWP